MPQQHQFHNAHTGAYQPNQPYVQQQQPQVALPPTIDELRQGVSSANSSPVGYGPGGFQTRSAYPSNPNSPIFPPSNMFNQQQQQPPLPPVYNQNQQFDALSAQMANLNVAQQVDSTSAVQQQLERHVVANQADGLPRPTLLHFHDQKQSIQPDVTSLFARAARNPEFSNIPFSRAQSSGRYMRPTVTCVPNAPALAKKWNLPLGVILHPLADQTFEGEIPTVHMGNAGIVRCLQCKTYINPFVTFLEFGKKWQCNMCKCVNDVPKAYYCALDEAGIRKDLAHRKELIYGSVEYIAPQEYMARVPQPPVYFFVMDVSYNAILSGSLVGMANAILSSLDQMIKNGNGRTMVGFITFDSSIHFYSLNPKLTQPQMLVVGELNDSLLPLPSDLLVNLEDSRAVVTALLEKFASGQMFGTTQNVESALGAALNAAGRVLGRVGGKLTVSLANLPTLGPNALSNREDSNLYGTDNENKLLQPVDNRFKEFALLYSRDHICCDLYLVSCGNTRSNHSTANSNSNQYLDLASLTCLSKFTGGDCRYYTFSGQPNVDADHAFRHSLKSDLQRSLTRVTGFEAVMRVRCSTGFEICNFYGNFFIRGHDLLALPNIDADKAFAVEVKLSGGQIVTPNACMQCAVLYTSSDGERRIRVHNICLPITSNLADLYKSADTPATINLMARIAADNSPKRGMPSMRNRIRDDIVNTLRNYRDLIKSTSNQSYANHNNQLVLPDSIKLLPLMAGALAKQESLLGGKEIGADERMFYLHLMGTSSVYETSAMIHPLLFNLDQIQASLQGQDLFLNLEEDEEEEEEEGGGNDLDDYDERRTAASRSRLDYNKVQLCPLNSRLIDAENGFLVLCDARSIYVYLGKKYASDQSFYQSICECISKLNHVVVDDGGARGGGDLVDKCFDLCMHLRSLYANNMPVKFVNRHPELYRRAFMRKLVEDKTIDSTLSYEEFLQHVYTSMASQ
ncbi:protein transport protein SEC24 [Acrasis kona]|uniref:Protein transport protein SEC24 n=1 Tax=Acrasis kona TaxID=1008807 RepID=A0AAW2ZN44_9EUKA